MAVVTQVKQNLFSSLPHSSLEWGFTLVYMFFYHRPYTFVVKARDIAAYHGLRDDHYALTVIGWALNDMVRRGFLERISKRAYMVTEKLEELILTHGFRCMDNSGLCGLNGTSSCPFRRGEKWR